MINRPVRSVVLRLKEKEENVLFNNAHNTFYVQLYQTYGKESLK